MGIAVPDRTLRDRTAITGIGYTKFSKESGVSVLHLAVEACLNAIRDAGLSIADVDGFVCYHENDTALARDVATTLGVPNLRWWSDVLAGGTFTCAVVGEAAMAVSAGLARHVVCYRVLNGRSGYRMGRFRSSNVSGVYQFMTPYGFGTPPQVFGMFCRRHMHDYGTTKEQMGRVAITMRAHAALNERATRREPLTMEQYLAARVIADPYSLYDCCQETDGGVALVVSPREVARDLRQPPVSITGVVHGGGTASRMPFDRWKDFSESAFRRLAGELYAQAGMRPADIDVAELYDAFTFEVILQLEEFGFCGRGEGGPFVAGGNIGLRGTLPVNTHGGLHSEAYIQGLNHVTEAVSQLRGQAGARQVAGARHALVTGFGFSAGSAMILRGAD